MRSDIGMRLAVPDWLGGVVPPWLAEVMRPKKTVPPWGKMALAVLAIWVPMAVAFGTGRRDLALLPAMGALLSVMIDTGGPYRSRVTRIGCAAVLGGAPGLLIGTVIHSRGWFAVLAVVVVAGVSAVLARLGAVGSVTGLQLFVYSALGLGSLGLLRPWWHTALMFLAGVVWSLLLITPGYLLSPRSAERRAVANVYHALAENLRQIGRPGSLDARTALTGALNVAYDAMLTGRAYASGRSRRDEHLLAVLNVSHQFAEATAALRATGERVPPLVTDEIDRLGDAIEHEDGPGAGVLGHRVSAADYLAAGGPPLPLVPPPWSSSAGALALREAMVTLIRVLSGNWTSPGPAAPDGGAPDLRARPRDRTDRVVEQLIGGRIAWEFTIRLMLCTGVAAVISQVLPGVQRSYWLVLTVGIIMKPDYGSVFARAVQRGVGTIVGAVLGAVILAVVPYGPWLLLPFGVLAALLPYGQARNFGLGATFLTPLVVVLIDLLEVSGWRLAETRLVDTVLASAIVLVVGYAPWPTAWQAQLPGQFAETLRAVCTYMEEALVKMPAARIAETGTATAPGRDPGAVPADTGPAWRSRLRRRTYRALSNLRVEFQRTMSEPTAVSRRASAWWPAVVALEEVMDAATANVVAIGRGGPVPPPGAVHALTGTLRAVADAIETGTSPRVPERLPDDPALAAVTSAVRTVLSALLKSPGDAEDVDLAEHALRDVRAGDPVGIPGFDIHLDLADNLVSAVPLPLGAIFYPHELLELGGLLEVAGAVLEALQVTLRLTTSSVCAAGSGRVAVPVKAPAKHGQGGGLRRGEGGEQEDAGLTPAERPGPSAAGSCRWSAGTRR